ncbi:MAG: hypothetical protein GF418_07065, partial [Chitinivibrionales bacterium]|nr:hypothetical protein [Chitinivibrionales bacterium]MBD3395371.1 hypothetical protein [Chitinivibrionales bacterium]
MHLKSLLVLCCVSFLFLYSGCDLLNLGNDEGDDGGDNQQQVTKEEAIDSLTAMASDSDDVDTGSTYDKQGDRYIITDENGDEMELFNVEIKGNKLSFDIEDTWEDSGETVVETLTLTFELVEGP